MTANALRLVGEQLAGGCAAGEGPVEPAHGGPADHGTSQAAEGRHQQEERQQDPGLGEDDPQRHVAHVARQQDERVVDDPADEPHQQDAEVEGDEEGEQGEKAPNE